ncbi:arsenate reductase ArsC [Roseateles toxinivorans]|uniref:Protein-tyrosine-phosphatase n=1 Tax=Roseateles toxinivorans TaxID=270368 RepID=A0A4V3CTZ6_9BURK|nr:arsenate reductase ArsC [Roseateles toxinivorans]TDP74778.1 protein-tyrosine-phosphatase [Roseateles toxinivorans]
MTERTYKVLFLCTGNSARSIIAEGLMSHLGAARFQAFSAGSHPTGAVNPLALQTLSRLHVSIDGFRSKSWDEFAGVGASDLDFVFTVCDKAAGEVCPVWPGQPMTAHWGVEDPSEVQGSEETKLRAFTDTALILKRRIELMLALPLERLDAMSLQQELHRLGKV